MGLLDSVRSVFSRNGAPKANDELEKEGPMTAMVIVAHPDDAEFMFGGTVAKWCAEGWTVYYVLVTSGDKGTHDETLSHQELAAIREQEQRDACKVLGAKDVIFLGYPDGFLEPSMELRGEIVKLLREYRPDVVLTWDGFRQGFNHSDHRAVGIAVRDAVYPAVRDHLYYPGHKHEGLDAHQVNEMLLGGTDDPDYRVDISAHLETKLNAIVCHKSQIGGTPEEVRKRWTERMQSMGRSTAMEHFKRVSIRRPMRQQDVEKQDGQKAEGDQQEETKAESAPAAAGQRS